MRLPHQVVLEFCSMQALDPTALDYSSDPMARSVKVKVLQQMYIVLLGPAFSCL